MFRSILTTDWKVRLLELKFERSQLLTKDEIDQAIDSLNTSLEKTNTAQQKNNHYPDIYLEIQKQLTSIILHEQDLRAHGKFKLVNYAREKLIKLCMANENIIFAVLENAKNKLTPLEQISHVTQNNKEVDAENLILIQSIFKQFNEKLTAFIEIINNAISEYSFAYKHAVDNKIKHTQMSHLLDVIAACEVAKQYPKEYMPSKQHNHFINYMAAHRNKISYGIGIALQVLAFALSIALIVATIVTLSTTTFGLGNLALFGIFTGAGLACEGTNRFSNFFYNKAKQNERVQMADHIRELRFGMGK